MRRVSTNLEVSLSVFGSPEGGSEEEEKITIFLMNDRLSSFPTRSSMIPDPLIRPFDRLTPPIRISVKYSKINILQSDSGVKVTTIGAIVCPIFIAGVVEAAFAAPGD